MIQGIRADAFFIPANRPARGAICGRTAAGKEGIVANDPSQQNDPATTDPTGTNAQAATAPVDLLHFIGQSDEGIGTTKAVYPDGWIASILESIRGISGDS